MPNGMSERSVLIEHCGVGGSVRKDTLYPIVGSAVQIKGGRAVRLYNQKFHSRPRLAVN